VPYSATAVLFGKIGLRDTLEPYSQMSLFHQKADGVGCYKSREGNQ